MHDIEISTYETTTELTLQKVVEMLEVDNNECVTVTGEPGIGKTELALQACHYMRERNRFSAIFFVHCRDVVAYQRSSATSQEPQTHIERLCHLVSGESFILACNLLSFIRSLSLHAIDIFTEDWRMMIVPRLSILSWSSSTFSSRKR